MPRSKHNYGLRGCRLTHTLEFMRSIISISEKLWSASKLRMARGGGK